MTVRIHVSCLNILVASLLLRAMAAPAAAATCSSVVHLASAPNPAVQGAPLTFTSGVTPPVGCTNTQSPTGTITLTDTSANPPTPLA